MTMAFLLDLGRCIGCQACTAACKTGNELAEGTQFIRLIEQTRGQFPDLTGGFKNHRCYHCTDASCVAVCPTGALFKEDGLTRLNRDVCSGCGYCVEACPFEVPQMVDGRSSKCDGCADTVAAGGVPWCVQTCPSNALMFGERDEIVAEAKKRVTALKARYPRARLYGAGNPKTGEDRENESGGLGLGVVMVLPDDPEVLDLPVNASVPPLISTWTRLIQPASLGLTATAAVAAGVVGVIARRNHMQELRAIEAENGDPAGDGEES